MRHSQRCVFLPPPRRGLRKTLIALLGWLVLGVAAPVQAEFILFPTVTGAEHTGLNPHPDVHHAGHTPDQTELGAELDLFYSTDKGRLRLLGELLASTDHPAHIERLQAGWHASPNATLWLGRFHSPLGYWNTQFHHGYYLQTAIKRPAASEFDDHGGILPTHLSGLFIEGQRARGDGAIGYALSFGAGPMLDSKGNLEPLDLLHPNRGTHKPGAMLRFGYRPDALSSTETGIFLGYTLIPSELAIVHEIRQAVAGAFINWEHERWRWIGELYSVRNDLDQPAGDARSSFVNANLQGEYAWRPDWTLYGRVENTFGERSGPYLMHFSNFAKERYLLGVRRELTRNQALKLELADVHVQGDSYGQLSLQWSAVFP